MAHISPLNRPSRIPLHFRPLNHHGDHHFMETPVMAAAETMLYIAGACRPPEKAAKSLHITNALFLKFIPIADATADPDSGHTVSFAVETTLCPDQSVRAALVSRSRSRRLGVTRSKTHVTLSLTHRHLPACPPPEKAKESALGEVNSGQIYKDLIHFGPAFQNLRKTLRLGRHWIHGTVWGGGDATVSPLPDVLGSPFPFDAAMQAACIWGQYFLGIVAFPEGVAQRLIYRRTRPQALYRIRLALRETDADHYWCDGWIMDSAGAVYEAFLGLKMRDLSRGRLKVPTWVERLNLTTHGNR
jgi:hypothetical protein